MLVVKIELWPRGDATKAREVGRMCIANVGGTDDRGDYAVAVCRRGTQSTPYPINPKGPKPTRHGVVRNYPRLAYNVWRLVARALRACFPEESTYILHEHVGKPIVPDPPDELHIGKPPTG